MSCRSSIRCHSERSEEPMHFAGSEELHRSFALLRMTSPCADCLPLQQIHFIHVDRLLITEEGDQDAEAYGSFGGGVGDYENREDLTVQRPGTMDSLPVRSEERRVGKEC